MELRPQARAHLIYAALLMGAAAWLGLIFAAPWLAARHHYTSAVLIYAAFSALCHQMPERSFHWLGCPLSACARCTGIYAGFLVGLATYPCARRLDDRRAPAGWWLLAAAAPTVIDFTGGAVGLFANTSASRAATGLIAGAAAAFYLLPVVVSIKFRASNLRSQAMGRGESSLPT